MNVRHSAAALLTLGLVIAVAGCSSGPDNDSVRAATTSTVTVTSPGTATSGTDVPAPTQTELPTTPPSGDSADPHRCRAADLSGSVVNRGGGTAGSEYGTLALTNTGSTVCTVTGYPGVSFVGDGNGTQLGAAADRDGSRVGTASVEPRGVATARIRIAEAGDFAGCDPVRADGLRIYPPGDLNSIFIPITAFTACRSTSAHLLTISPLR